MTRKGGKDETASAPEEPVPLDPASGDDRDTVREQLVEVRESLGKLGRTAVRRSGARSRAVVDSSKQRVDDSYRTLTLREYRDEVDRALADITHVLVVLESRVSALEAAADRDG